MATLKGKFRPKNWRKYRGDPTRIVYRSSWELKYMKRLDEDTDVLEWNSEEVIVRYRCPLTGKTRRYFTDFYVKRRVGDQIVEALVEIKPRAQTLRPVLKEGAKKPSRKYLKDAAKYAINSAKWSAAQEYCKARKWLFLILTEKELGIK